jgi:hypothetical protein
MKSHQTESIEALARPEVDLADSFGSCRLSQQPQTVYVWGVGGGSNCAASTKIFVVTTSQIGVGRTEAIGIVRCRPG